MKKKINIGIIGDSPLSHSFKLRVVRKLLDIFCINIRYQMKIIECVPNFSEGRNLENINLITDSIKSVRLNFDIFRSTFFTSIFDKSNISLMSANKSIPDL